MGSTRVREVYEEEGVTGQQERQARRERDATQGISGKRVCRGLDSMGRRGNEATTQGISTKMVCREWDYAQNDSLSREVRTQNEN